jgi:hypothetical protein
MAKVEGAGVGAGASAPPRPAPLPLPLGELQAFLTADAGPGHAVCRALLVALLDVGRRVIQTPLSIIILQGESLMK